jgi:hypothetical protein
MKKLPIRNNNILDKKILIEFIKTWLLISLIMYQCLKQKITYTTGNIMRTMELIPKTQEREEENKEEPLKIIHPYQFG